MTCRLCGGSDLHLKYTIHLFDPAFEIYECSSCGFQQQKISEAEAYKFYDEGYYKGKNSFSYLDEREQEEASAIVWRARMRYLARKDKSLVKDPKFLDVGCSFGGLMNVAEQFGYQSYGVEVSEYSGEYAKKRFGEDRIFLGNIEDLSLPKSTFSVVTLIEVIEHLFRPRIALQNLFESMQSGGVILIQTADMDGLQARRKKDRYHYYLPGHLSYFNRYNLRRLMEECGWRDVRFIGGVEFGLLPKLRKSRYSFKSIRDYAKWFNIARYHLMSRITIGSVHLTSSMVMVGRKPLIGLSSILVCLFICLWLFTFI